MQANQAGGKSSGKPAAPAQPAQPQLTDAPRFENTGGGQWVDRQQTEADAKAIMTLRDLRQAPSQGNISRLGITSHPRQKRALDYLARYGVVTPERPRRVA